MARYPQLPDGLKAQLQRIEPSHCYGLDYYPCLVTLRSGKTLDRVYIVAERPYMRAWGVYPEDDPAKKWIRIEEVGALAESPSRLPQRFANQLYEAGESGMGCTIFEAVFSDGTNWAYGCGNAVDFIEYPPNLGPSHVVKVRPHQGRDRNLHWSLAYYWCIFSENDSQPDCNSLIQPPKTPASRLMRFLHRILFR